MGEGRAGRMERGKWIKKRWKGNSDKKLRVHRSLFALVNTTRLSAKVTNEKDGERGREREREVETATPSFRNPLSNFPVIPSLHVPPSSSRASTTLMYTSAYTAYVFTRCERALPSGTNDNERLRM